MTYDHRYYAHAKSKWYGKLNTNKTKVLICPEDYFSDDDVSEEEKCTIDLINDDGYIALPFIFDVCPTCNGKGSYVNPDIDSNGITEGEWENWSYEEQEEYLSGYYDITCAECNGQRVVPIIDKTYLSEAEKVFVKMVEKKREEEYKDAVERQREFEMGY